MSAQFKVGDVCIWQNCSGEWAYLNGVQTTIIGGVQPARDLVSGAWALGYLTDTPHPHKSGESLLAAQRELRKKQPPGTGEQMIRAMFDALPVERRQPVTAWQAQYDTAQALMRMGVRVKPGKWPVEVA